MTNGIVQKLLNKAEDIVILEKNPAQNKYRFAFPFSGEFARQIFEATLKLNADLPEFQGYWSFNQEKKRIEGLSNYHQARLKRVLPQEVELLDSRDLFSLQKQGKLISGFLRDCGIAVYSDGIPNQETAKALIEKAGIEGWELPLLFSPNDLAYIVDNGHAKIVPVEKPRRLISGKQAEKELERFYQGSRSGACGAYRGRNGYWNANWDDFAYSGSDCLVDWLVAEGDRENLREGYSHLFSRKYNAKRIELQAQIDSLSKERASEEEAVLLELKA